MTSHPRVTPGTSCATCFRVKVSLRWNLNWWQLLVTWMTTVLRNLFPVKFSLVTGDRAAHPLNSHVCSTFFFSWKQKAHLGKVLDGGKGNKRGTRLQLRNPVESTGRASPWFSSRDLVRKRKMTQLGVSRQKKFLRKETIFASVPPWQDNNDKLIAT